MALSNSTVWELRPGSGNDTNGGGFVTGATGTDYSQQNSKNTVGSDISTTDAVANGTTTITSATANFGTSIVGNIIYLAGGSGSLTGVWRQVTARASTTSITVDANVATGTGITLNIGGALNTIGQLATNMTLSGMIGYIKATATITTTAVTTIVAGNYAPPLRFVGYTTTRGDNGKVTWTTSTNSIKLVNTSNLSGLSFENIHWTCTAGTPGDCIHPTTANCQAVHFRNCIIDGFNIGINGNFAVDWWIDGLCVENSEIKNCVSHGIENSGMTHVLGSTIHNNGGCGVLQHISGTTNCSLMAAYSAFKSNTSDGAQIDSFVRQGFMSFVNCDFVNNGGTGLNCNTSTGGNNLVCWNCIFYGNTTYQISGSSSVNGPGMTAFQTNAFGADGTARYNLCTNDTSDVSLSADPFTSRTGTPPDLSLNSTAGGGAACKGAATPATLPFS